MIMVRARRIAGKVSGRLIDPKAQLGFFRRSYYNYLLPYTIIG